MEYTDHPEEASPEAGLSTGRRRLRTFRFPVLLVALGGVLVAFSEINNLVAPVPFLALPVGIGLAVVGVFCYRWLTRTVESRTDVPELAEADRWPRLRQGALAGAGLLTLVMLLVAVCGGWGETSWGSFGGFIGTVGMMASVAVIEEVVFRGVVFRILEDRFGSVVSLTVSALLFGATHLVNSGATLWGAFAIAVTGGAMLPAAYLVTRSLWAPIGLHFAWNTMLGGVFGVVVSGAGGTADGLLRTTLSGPALVTGGDFGPEASLVTLVVGLVPVVFLLRHAARTGQIRPRPRRTRISA